MPMRFHFRPVVLPAVLALLLTACATRTAYYQDMDRMTAAGDYSRAAALAEESREKVYGQKNALLYYLDRGMFLHLEGKYRESNDAFEKAKELADSYFTKSITAEASTFLVNDTMRPYYGEDFERALINVFRALNYALLGMDREALVEARQVDHFLTTLQSKYGHKNVYREDAFVRYLMGMLYENCGEANDAYISYWKALESYEEYARAYGVTAPARLAADALRLGRKLGMTDDVRELERKWGKSPETATGPGDAAGEIVVLHYNGQAPVKTDSFFEISFGRAWVHVEGMQPQGEEAAQVEQARAIARSIIADEQVRMAFPRFTPRPYRISDVKARVLTPAGSSSTGEAGALVEDIGAIAVKNLDDRIARIRVRTIARAAIKYALSRRITDSVQKQNGEALGWLVEKALSAASAATELADKRSWRSLPDRIRMVRLPAEEGACGVELSFLDASGNVVERKTLGDVVVRRGRKTFVVVRTVY